MNETPRGFRGIWIPAEIWLDERIGAIDKILLSEIDSLDNGETGCTASNRTLAAFCQCSERRITDGISALKQHGYIIEETSGGRQRTLKRVRGVCVNETPSANEPAYPASFEPQGADNRDYKRYSDAYNRICTNLAKVRFVTETRRSEIRTFEKNFTFEQFEEICGRANASDFLCGKNTANGWKADFDFLIRPKSAAKILEGGFDNPRRTSDIPQWN